MEPMIVGFRLQSGQELGNAWTQLDQGLGRAGARPSRHWHVEESNYLVIDDPPAWEKVGQIMKEADVELTGAARLVVEQGTGDAEPRSASDVLPDEIDHELQLVVPAEGDPFTTPEWLICGECGGMNGEHLFDHS